MTCFVLQEGTDSFDVVALVPVTGSFGFSEEIRRKSRYAGARINNGDTHANYAYWMLAQAALVCDKMLFWFLFCLFHLYTVGWPHLN